MKTVVIINQHGMGHGDPELGRKILKTFLTKAPGAFDSLEAIAFYNAGVRCLIEGSELLPALSTLSDSGVDLLACGTCVDHLELRDKIRIGVVAGMDDILREIEAAEKVVTV